MPVLLWRSTHIWGQTFLLVSHPLQALRVHAHLYPWSHCDVGIGRYRESQTLEPSKHLEFICFPPSDTSADLRPHVTSNHTDMSEQLLSGSVKPFPSCLPRLRAPHFHVVKTCAACTWRRDAFQKETWEGGMCVRTYVFVYVCMKECM